MKNILVLGGTGLLGEPVVRNLITDGFHVRLLTRDSEKAKSIFNESIEILEGDVTQLSSLENAMMGCDYVHISIGGEHDQTIAENVASLAHNLGLERICYVSGSTVAEQNGWFPMIKQKLMAEKAIRECGVPYTIICPTWPMEQLPRFVQKGRVTLIGKQKTPLHWYSREDFGEMISRSFLKKEAANKRLYFHGPEGIPMKEALERYCSVFHPEIKSVSVLPIWFAKTLGTLMRNDMLKMFANIMAYFDKAGELGDPTEANQILGAPVITLDLWLEEMKKK